MKSLLSYDGWSFPDNGFSAKFEFTNDRGFGVTPQLRALINASPAYLGGQPTVRTIATQITYAGDLEMNEAFDLLVGALDPENTTPRRLVGKRVDDTVVETMAVVTLPAGRTSQDDFNWLLVTFIATERVWRALDATETTHPITGAADLGMPLFIEGHAPVYPEISIQPTAVRVASDTHKGWKYRKSITITENKGKKYSRRWMRLPLGDTTPLTTTKAQADGDDLLIIDAFGRIVPRSLVTWDTAASYAWILIDSIDPGETLTYYMVYGNPNATTPASLTYPDLPIFDLSNSTNTHLKYDMSAGHGLWYIDNASAPSIVDPHVPGSWQWLSYLPNTDDYAQSRSFGTAGSLVAHLHVDRGRENALALEYKRLHDGIQFYDPAGVVKIRADFAFKNPSDVANPSGVAKLRVVVKRAGGESWGQVLLDHTTTHATLTTIAAADYTPAVPSEYVAIVLLPANGIAVPDATDPATYATAQTITTFEVDLDSAAFTVTGPTAEESIYDFYGNFYANAYGGLPQQWIAMGGVAGGNDEVTNRLFIPLNNWLVIKSEERTAQEWDSTLATKIADHQTALAIVDRQADRDGVAHSYAAQTGLRLRPRPSPSNNPSFDPNLTGWTAHDTHANVTMGWLAESSTKYDVTGGSAKGTVTVNTAPTATSIAVLSNTDASSSKAVEEGQLVQFAGAIRTDNTALIGLLRVEWQNAAGSWTTLPPSTMGSWTPDAANIWFFRAVSAIAPAGAVAARMAVVIHYVSGTGTGTVFFDSLDYEGNFLNWDSGSFDGGLSIKVGWVQGYL